MSPDGFNARAAAGGTWAETPLMLEDLLLRRPYNAAADLVDANVARGLGRKLAFVDPERSLTYEELQARTLRHAAALNCCCFCLTAWITRSPSGARSAPAS